MVIPKVRLLMDGLPWNTEGYEQVKNVLSQKSGKSIKLANTHIHYILLIIVIAGANPDRIKEFYENLMTSVQSLNTMRKLKQINRYVQTTIDKLPGIRVDLERMNSNWHK